MHSSVPLNPRSILFTQHNQQIKIILFTEDLVPTKYPHPSLLMNYGCLDSLPETWLGYVKSFSGECVLFWMKQAGKRPVGLKWILSLKQLTKYSSSYHFVSVAYFFPDPFSRLWLVLSSTLCISQGTSEGGCCPGPVATGESVDTRTRRLLLEPQLPSHWVHYPNPSMRKGHPSFCSLSLRETIPPGIIWKYCEALILWNHKKELSDSLMKKGMVCIYLILCFIQSSLNLFGQY